VNVSCVSCRTLFDCIFKTGGTNVTIILRETRVESDCLFVEAADAFGEDLKRELSNYRAPLANRGHHLATLF